MITDPKTFPHWLLQSAREEAERHFDVQKLLCIIPRETAWYCICLLESDKGNDQDLADRILSKLFFADGTHSPCTLDLILRHYVDKLSVAARNNILNNLRHNLPISATVRYHDGNVNHPIAAMVNLILSGERFNLPAYVELGRTLLHDFHLTIANRQHRFYRQAEMAEYNSPTYTALNLWFLALAAEFADNCDIREQALELEKQLWLDVALHWHGPTQQFAGPFSRAYAEDSLGGFSGLHCTFAKALGCAIFLEPDLPRLLNHPSALIQNAMIAVVPFHVPSAARRLAFDKSLPLLLRCTTYGESYHENAREKQTSGKVAFFDSEVYPGGWSELNTYQHPDFSLGSAGRPYVNAAQSDALVLRLRRATSVRSIADFRSLTTRMVFNHSLPGQQNYCHTANLNVGSDYLYEEGRTLVYQHDNRAIEVVSPKRPGSAAVSRLRLDLLWNDAAPFDGLYADGQQIGVESDLIDWPRFLVWTDGPVAVAVVPLFVRTLVGAEAFVQFHSRSPYWICSFVLYQGEPQDLSRDELSAAGIGLGFWVVSLRDKSLESIFTRLEESQAHYCAKMSGSERIDWHLDKELMEFEFNRISERITVQHWNGIDDRESWFSLHSDNAQKGDLPTCLFKAT